MPQTEIPENPAFLLAFTSSLGAAWRKKLPNAAKQVPFFVSLNLGLIARNVALIDRINLFWVEKLLCVGEINFFAHEYIE